MMDSITVDARTSEFEQGLLRLKQGVKDGIIHPDYGTLRVQSRLLAERCQAFTPPANVGQGRAAVTKDIVGLFHPVSETTWTNKRIKQVVRQDNRQDWAAIARNLPETTGLRDTTAVSFRPGLHKQMRNGRGKVSASAMKNKNVTLGPEAKKVMDFLKAQKKWVGYAKSGWNAAITRLGGIVSANWIARHPQSSGDVIISDSLPNPFVRAINRTGWAANRNSEGRRVVQNAISARARDMQKYFEKQMELAAKKAEHK